MQVFTEFVRTDLTEDQLIPVMRELLPVLMSILIANEVSPASIYRVDRHDVRLPARPATFSPHAFAYYICLSPVRRSTVHGQRSTSTGRQGGRRERVTDLVGCLQGSPGSRPSAGHFRRTLGRTGNPHPDFQGAHFINPIFYRVVYSSGWEGQTLDTIHTSFPRVVAPYLPAYIASSLRHLHALYATYMRYYLTDSVTVPNSSEGEPIELYKLITPLVDFLTGATRQSKARVSFDQSTLSKLVDALVQWSQMTKENVSWPPSFLDS